MYSCQQPQQQQQYYQNYNQYQYQNYNNTQPSAYYHPQQQQQQQQYYYPQQQQQQQNYGLASYGQNNMYYNYNNNLNQTSFDSTNGLGSYGGGNGGNCVSISNDDIRSLIASLPAPSYPGCMQPPIEQTSKYQRTQSYHQNGNNNLFYKEYFSGTTDRKIPNPFFTLT
jgi:hypothetical protein